MCIASCNITEIASIWAACILHIALVAGQESVRAGNVALLVHLC